MTTPNFRALCAALADELELNRRCLLGDITAKHPLAERARAALAAEPQGAIGEDVLDEAIAIYAHAYRESAGMSHNGFGPARGTVHHQAGLRAILARWGNTAPRPIPVTERLPGNENAQEIAWALIHVLDGVKRHDLEEMTGLPEPECDRIWDAKQIAHDLPLPEIEG